MAERPECTRLVHEHDEVVFNDARRQKIKIMSRPRGDGPWAVACYTISPICAALIVVILDPLVMVE